MNPRKTAAQDRPFLQGGFAFIRRQWVAAALFLAIAAGLSICYPDPFITSDSGEYINSALRLANNPYRPIGYSLFLAAVHALTSSPQAVPVFQSLVYLASPLYLLRRINQAVSLSRSWNTMLGVLLVLNPVPFIITRHILSDSLFISLTIFFIAGVLRYVSGADRRGVAEMLLWSGASLLVRHVGLLYMVFAAVVIVLKMKRRALKPLVVFAGGSALVILSVCFKMKEDLGVFRLNTFDGWTLWSATAKYIDLSPDYRKTVTPPEVRVLYEYFASYPPETYTEKSGFWNLWSKESPAKRLHFYYMQQYHMDYYTAWITTNDDLNKIARDVLRHRFPAYIVSSVLPSVVASLWPGGDIGDTGWKNYPRYPAQSEPDRVIQFYYGQNSSSWSSRYEIFPALLPVAGVWGKILAPLAAILLLLLVAVRKTAAAAAEMKVVVVACGFVILYILGISMISEVVTRYVAPITPVFLALIFLALSRLAGVRPVGRRGGAVTGQA